MTDVSSGAWKFPEKSAATSHQEEQAKNGVYGKEELQYYCEGREQNMNLRTQSI